MVLYWEFLCWVFPMGLEISGDFHIQSLQSLLPFKPELDLCTVTNINIFLPVSPLQYLLTPILACIFLF